MPPCHSLLFLEDFYAETEMTHGKVTSVGLIRETVTSELENTAFFKGIEVFTLLQCSQRSALKRDPECFFLQKS